MKPEIYFKSNVSNADVNKGETEIELNDFMSRFRSLDFGPVTKM